MQRDTAGMHGAQPCLLDKTGMAAVQILCQAQKDIQDPHDVLGAWVECGECWIFLAGEGLALVERCGRHNGNFCLVKAQQIGMADEVVGVGLVISVRQEGPDVMQQRCILQELTLPPSQLV
jgi:hypothetical protein